MYLTKPYFLSLMDPLSQLQISPMAFSLHLYIFLSHQHILLLS
ncbi:hypothetical protein MtrunA17_Chr1g0170481 [Medicago truncatula]|uniref:Uncharacterized protein n=1 Tax=Medicago truncatula TaxID=3880 RepID=A0A396JNR4_MEDTR|nr:hypothetical protein MtrunA17_Chr1g0170481 [Medicago truncatula]